MTQEQLVNLSSEEMVNNFLVAKKDEIVNSVKQVLAVAEIFKSENLEVPSHSFSVFLLFLACIMQRIA